MVDRRRARDLANGHAGLFIRTDPAFGWVELSFGHVAYSYTRLHREHGGDAESTERFESEERAQGTATDLTMLNAVLNPRLYPPLCSLCLLAVSVSLLYGLKIVPAIWRTPPSHCTRSSARLK